jgi:hypothetical protein
MVNSRVAMLRLLCELYVAMQRSLNLLCCLATAKGIKDGCDGAPNNNNKKQITSNKRQTRQPGRDDTQKTETSKCKGSKHLVMSPRRGSKPRPNV